MNCKSTSIVLCNGLYFLSCVTKGVALGNLISNLFCFIMTSCCLSVILAATTNIVYPNFVEPPEEVNLNCRDSKFVQE